MSPFSTPGKTFLVGEYIALAGGPCLIYCSSPTFEFSVEPALQLDLGNLHPDSPAGRWLLKHKAHLPYKISFKTPYAFGGLGASTAEFLSAYQLVCQNTDQPFSLEKLLHDYLSLHADQATPPSGADLIAQATGCGLISYEKQHGTLEHFKAWPFKSLTCFLVHTKDKQPTYKHLNSLKEQNFKAFYQPAYAAQQAVKTQNATDFIDAINHYNQLLHQAELVTTHSKALQTTLKKQHLDILACKGCGALGADTLLILCQSQHAATISETLSSLDLPLITKT